MVNLDAITNKNNKKDDKKWPYRMLIIGPSAIPHTNSETKLPAPIISVVWKYLRQFLGTSFGVATLPISCNIERGERPDLFLESGPFQNFHEFFQEFTWSQ